MFLIYILDKVKFDEKTIKQMFGYGVFSAILVLGFCVVFFVTFQTTSFVHTYAILDIIQFVSDFGTVGKFDIIAITAVMFAIYFQLGILVFCVCDAMNKVIPFGHFSQPIIVVNVIFIVVSFLIYNNANNFVFFVGNYLKYFSIFVVYAIPVLFLVLGFCEKQKLVKK